MLHVYGIILLEETAIIIRIYEVNTAAWKLIHYQNYPTSNRYIKDNTDPAETITTLIATFFTTERARCVTQWKTVAHGITSKTVNYISSSLGMEIELLSQVRKQELLCKGLFTEFW